MATTEQPKNFFGVLLAGSTPEVNEVQCHQDKLGEYFRTGGTLHGRPAYKKDNNTNHMLWFCFANDGTATWYVGKEEEFGQARGWLQVKSDAMTPHEITKEAWSVWSISEKQWKSAPEVKSIAVSATSGVIIHGPTPSNLLQDKLGEYRRVQLRVITERGVYEMVGMPNVMMWCAHDSPPAPAEQQKLCCCLPPPSHRPPPGEARALFVHSHRALSLSSPHATGTRQEAHGI